VPRRGTKKPSYKEEAGMTEITPYAIERVYDATEPHPVRPENQRLVVDAGTMSADILYLHVRTRHRELDGDKMVSILRDHHAQSHDLIPRVLDHYHEDPGAGLTELDRFRSRANPTIETTEILH
jgi:hypothetical protein